MATKNPISFAAFLEKTPPNCPQQVSDATTASGGPGRSVLVLSRPRLQLSCTKCEGIRSFDSLESLPQKVPPSAVSNFFIEFKCSNCSETRKLFALRIAIDMEKTGPAVCVKYGEVPVFGPRTPNRLLRLFGSDREDFLKGRQCENQGLGIGAFSYYRRVVENQKNQILDEMIKALKKLGTNSEIIAELEDAKGAVQFSDAMKFLKGKLPADLLIKEQNPLALLHSALSKGLHGHSDEECLRNAQNIRVVLTEFSRRLQEVLKNNQELDNALNGLLNPPKE